MRRQRDEKHRRTKSMNTNKTSPTADSGRLPDAARYAAGNEAGNPLPTYFRPDPVRRGRGPARQSWDKFRAVCAGLKIPSDAALKKWWERGASALDVYLARQRMLSTDRSPHNAPVSAAVSETKPETQNP